jgi:hypothetical protein
VIARVFSPVIVPTFLLTTNNSAGTEASLGECMEIKNHGTIFAYSGQKKIPRAQPTRMPKDYEIMKQ